MIVDLHAFAEEYNIPADDPDLIRIYNYVMSAKHEQASREYNIRMRYEEGYAEGFAKGLREARMERIRRMLENDLPVDIIYQCFDAPQSEIDALIAEIRAENE